MTPARVLHVITGLRIGGAERLVVSAATGLPRDAFENAVCCLAERGALATEVEQAGVPVWLVGEFPGLRHPVAFWRLWRIIARYKPQIVHTHLQSANLYGRLAARLAGVPVIVATEHNVYRAKARRYIVVERALARVTDAIVAVSEQVRGFLSEQLDVAARTMRVIPNGVAMPVADPDRVAALRARLDLPAGDIVLGTVASLTPKKGHSYLIEALALAAARSVPCTLVLAGDGPMRPAIEQLAERLGVSSRVRFLGEAERVADVLAITDVFVLPSLVEGMPLALLEAMRVGRAVVATRVGGVPELVRDGDNGVLVEPADAAALAEAVATLAADPARRDHLGDRARATVERDYTEERYVAALAGLYRELLAAKGAA